MADSGGSRAETWGGYRRPGELLLLGRGRHSRAAPPLSAAGSSLPLLLSGAHRFPVVTGGSGSFPPCPQRRGAPDSVLKPRARWSGVRLLKPPAPSPPKSECVGLPEGIARGSRERLLRPFHDVWASSRIPPLRELPSSLPFPRSNSELLLVFEVSVCLRGSGHWCSCVWQVRGRSGCFRCAHGAGGYGFTPRPRAGQR